MIEACLITHLGLGVGLKSNPKAKINEIMIPHLVCQ